MENYDWSKFTQRIAVKASIQKIYDYWATQKNLEKWFLRLSEFSDSENCLKDSDTPIQKNDSYKWMWHGYSDEVVENGKILEANGHNRIQFTFADPCVVTVNIYKEADQTVMELTQSNIPLDEHSKTQFHLGCSNGWTFYLANLKSILEGGIDLRNKDTTLTKVINA